MGVTVAALAACGGSRPPAPAGPPPTWARDVAPILYAKCVACHRDGELAPFPLVRYADARMWSDSIAIETKARVMPPWLPEPASPEFMGVRRLTDAEIDVLQRWHAAGAPEGDATAAPAPPAFTANWQLGAPDALATMATPYVLAPGTRDITRNVVLRVAVPATRFVRAVEFRTGGAPIHHAVIRVDPTPASRHRDGRDGQPGFEGMGSAEVQDPDGHFIGWTPGRGPILSPEGLPWRLERGTDLVVELHLVPGKKAAPVQPQVALFFTETPPARVPVFLKMGSKAIDLPAGAASVTISDTWRLPADADLLSLYPHAHFLGKQMTVSADFPDGTTRTLLRIPRWDFRWQQDYRFASPLKLPRGTVLTMRYVYDNSAANRANPSVPPVPVYFGPRSVDEMASLGVQLLPATDADGRAMAAEFDRRETQQNIDAGQAAMRRNPRDPQGLLLYGGSLVDAGRGADAVPALEAAVREQPDYAPAFNYLGGAYLAAGRLDDARQAFARAAALSPDDARYVANVGNVLLQGQRLRDAEAAFRKALTLDPDFAAAHANLGLILFSTGRAAAALPHFQRAATLQPDSAAALSDLGAALAATGRRQDAIAALERALAIDPQYAPARENLQKLRMRK